VNYSLSNTQDPAGLNSKLGGALTNQNKMVSVNLSFADPQQFKADPKPSVAPPPLRPPRKYEHTLNYTTASFKIGSNSQGSQSSLERDASPHNQSQELLT